MRVRLWLAMLGLAVLPMVGVIVLTNTITSEEQLGASEHRAWQTSAAAADLTARLQALETRRPQSGQAH
jgi:hypothetical protein